MVAFAADAGDESGHGSSEGMLCLLRRDVTP